MPDCPSLPGCGLCETCPDGQASWVLVTVSQGCGRGGGQEDTGLGLPDVPGAGFVRIEGLSVGVRELCGCASIVNC